MKERYKTCKLIWVLDNYCKCWWLNHFLCCLIGTLNLLLLYYSTSSCCLAKIKRITLLLIKRKQWRGRLLLKILRSWLVSMNWSIRIVRKKCLFKLPSWSLSTSSIFLKLWTKKRIARVLSRKMTFTYSSIKLNWRPSILTLW